MSPSDCSVGLCVFLLKFNTETVFKKVFAERKLLVGCSAAESILVNNKIVAHT